MKTIDAGAGCVIGFTGDLGDKVIPNIVGVDIGCGMRILRLGRLSDIDYHAFNEHILANIPSGMRVREDKYGFTPLGVDEMDIYREAKQLLTELYCYRELKDTARIKKAIGSLGGGNHFIELDKDEESNVYLVIHTGSRNLGKLPDAGRSYRLSLGKCARSAGWLCRHFRPRSVMSKARCADNIYTTCVCVSAGPCSTVSSYLVCS